MCRNWYVLLITDGEEQCGGNVCADGQAADLFGSTTGPAPAVKVSTIGFTLPNDPFGLSPLNCIADKTGGDFKTASNAQELADQLNAIINQYQTVDSSFASATVSPQLSTSLASEDTSYLLTVPVFVPENGKSIWDGHLHTFLLDKEHPSPPVDAEGKLDPTSPYCKWDAGVSLATQLHGASPYRNLYWPFNTGSWARVSLADVKTDATRKAEFRVLTGDSRITDAVADDVVDFMYFFNTDDRPYLYPALGDIYHSRPVIVGAPRNTTYKIRNIHNYATFESGNQHRRRVVFAGGNDGLLHAFDIGQYVDADHAYDTGTGQELFGVMPQAVMPNLYPMAAQSGSREQQYMVDGPISSTDVHIDINYSGDPGGSDEASRTWRTVVLATMRAGGRSMLALDVTMPDDPASPPIDAQPTCLNGGGGCSGTYPRVMWEFTDQTDADDGCSDTGKCTVVRQDCCDLGRHLVEAAHRTGEEGVQRRDVRRLLRRRQRPPGRRHHRELPLRGRHRDGSDHLQGEHERLDSRGHRWHRPGRRRLRRRDLLGHHQRLHLQDGPHHRGGPRRRRGPAVPPGKRVTNWTPQAMYSFGADVKFFMTPVVVPVLFDAGGYRYAVAIGAGDRDNIDEESDLVGHFYFALDYPGGLRNDTNLQEVLYNAPAVDPSTNYFRPSDPSDPVFGWYLTLREGEKVSTDALVAAEKVVFPTFVRTPLDRSAAGRSRRRRSRLPGLGRRANLRGQLPERQPGRWRRHALEWRGRRRRGL